MSVFLERNHLFVRTPGGNVEDVEVMAAAGFRAIFCNVGDHPPEDWYVVRDRAAACGVVCGPWARVESNGELDPAKLERLLETADRWGTPVIVNAENELDHTGSAATSYIAEAIGDRDAAISMQPWPFEATDWSPFAELPVLPQVFGAGWAADAADVREQWHRRGVRCVVLTFGSYAASPAAYDRLAPFGVYTADDCAQNYRAWSPVGELEPCSSSTAGGDMTIIGSQHGITAACNRLRDLDPLGTILTKQGGKWPPLSTLDGFDPSTWKAWDKLERTLSILAADHDAEAST